MKGKINQVKLNIKPASELIHQENLDEMDSDDIQRYRIKGKDILMADLFKALGKALERGNWLKNVPFSQTEKAVECLDLPTEDIEETSIDVALIPSETIEEVLGEGRVGVKINSSDNYPFEPLHESPYAERHLLALNCSYEYLLGHMVEERLKEINPQANHHDHSYLNAFLVTLTHEIEHNLDFLRNSHGMTPAQAGEVFPEGRLCCDEEEEIPFFEDISYGTGVDPNIDFYICDEDELVNRMEERVEERGIEMFHDALDDEEFSVSHQSFLDIISKEVSLKIEAIEANMLKEVKSNSAPTTKVSQ